MMLKNKVNEETDEEWTEAHIENDLRDGKYIGREEIFDCNPNYFKKMNVDEIDSKILSFLKEATGEEPKLEQCDCLKYKNLGLCSVNPEKPRKVCRNNRDYFSNCCRIA